MLIDAGEFLRECAGSWIAARAAEFPVLNVHRRGVAAPAERAFRVLSSPELITPRRRWRMLLGLRGAIGKVLGWDQGLRWHGKQELAAGNHWVFFTILHVTAPGDGVAPPYELGLGVANRLTRTIMSFVVVAAGDEATSRIYCATCSLFFGRIGRAYWRMICPFHDAIVEDMLAAVERKASS